MSETRPDPERIYLEPAPGSPEGRMWCEDDVWIDGDEPGGVEYVRADLHDAEIDRLRRIIVADGLDPDAPIPPGLATELARLTRELEEARERERALREAHERSVGVFRRACEIAEAAIVAGETPETASARLRDAIEADIAEINALVALSTPQEADTPC